MGNFNVHVCSNLHLACVLTRGYSPSGTNESASQHVLVIALDSSQLQLLRGAEFPLSVVWIGGLIGLRI